MATNVNSEEIAIVEANIDDEEMKQFLVKFLCQKLEVSETYNSIYAMKMDLVRLEKLLKLLVSLGCVISTQLFLLCFEGTYAAEFLTRLAELAVKCKKLIMLQLLHTRNAILSPEFLTIAITNLDIPTVDYLLKHGTEIEVSDAERLILFLATRISDTGFKLFVKIEDYIKSKNLDYALKNTIRIANETDNEKLLYYLLEKNLFPIFNPNQQIIIDATNIINNEGKPKVEARWNEITFKHWLPVTTKVIMNLSTRSWIVLLDISKNNLENMPSELFRGHIPTLLVLIASDNELKSMPNLRYPCDNNIICLDVKDNSLEELPFAYLCMPKLEKLYVNNNKISRFLFWIDDRNSKQCCLAAEKSPLMILDLSDNQLMSLPNEIGYLKKLNELKCMGNKLERVISTWHNSSSLETIDLSHNMLTAFPFSTPPGLWKMTINKLNLSDNLFNWVPIFILKLRALITLDFSNNNLHQFPKASQWECQLTDLKLINNPMLFAKDCVYNPDTELDQDQQGKELDLTCFNKTIFSLDISNNNLLTIPYLITKLTSLRFLYFNDNPKLNNITPELSHLQSLIIIGVQNTPLTGLPIQFQPKTNEQVVRANDVLNYLEDIRLEASPLPVLQLILLGEPSILLQHLELDLKAIGRKKITIGQQRRNIRYFDTILYRGGKLREKFHIKNIGVGLRLRVWVLDNLDGFRAIGPMLEGERTLYIVTYDLSERDAGLVRTLDWMDVVFGDQRKIIGGRVVLFIGCSQPIERSKQREYERKIRDFLNYRNLYEYLVNRDGETTRKVLYNWGENIYITLRKVPKYMQTILMYFEENYKYLTKNFEYSKQTSEFFYFCTRLLSKEQMMSDKDKVRLTKLLQSCGYLYHCDDTWCDLNSFYFLRVDGLYEFCLRFVSTSPSGLITESGKMNMDDILEIIECQTNVDINARAMIALLEKFELAFHITRDIILITQFLNQERPAIITQKELDEEVSIFIKSKRHESKHPKPCHRRFYLFPKLPNQFFTILTVNLTSHSHSKREDLSNTSFHLAANNWNLIIWSGGMEAFIGNEHIIITTASVEHLKTELLKDHILIGNKITDEQTIELRRAHLTQYIYVSIYSTNPHTSVELIGRVCDTIEDLLHDERFLSINDYCIRMVSCESCIYTGRLHLLDINDCLENGWKIICKYCKAESTLGELVPDMLLKDMENKGDLMNRLIITLDEIGFKEGKSEILGVGGEARVYKHYWNGTFVAIKVLTLPKTNAFPYIEEIAEMRKQIMLMCKLVHPNMVKLNAVSINPSSLILEYAPFGALNVVLDYHIQQQRVETLAKGVLGSTLTHLIALEIAYALEFLHKNNIIYFDLKSANVLIFSLDVNHKIHAKLTDYGIAKIVCSRGVKGLRGTYGFMAPELFPEDGVTSAVNEKVDVFSYAFVLLELIFGRNPYNVDRAGQTRLNNGARPTLKPKEVPSNMAVLIKMCWQHQPKVRPTASSIVNILSDIKFFLHNNSWTINVDGEINASNCLRIASNNPQKGEDMYRSLLIESLLLPYKKELSDSTSTLDSDASIDNVPDSQFLKDPGKLIHMPLSINEPTQKCYVYTDQLQKVKSHSNSIRESESNTFIFCSLPEGIAKISKMDISTGEYEDLYKLNYQYVSALQTHLSFIWCAVSKGIGEKSDFIMCILNQPKIVLHQCEDEEIQELQSIPLEQTNTHVEIKIIAQLNRSVIQYFLRISGNILSNDSSYTIENFDRYVILSPKDKVNGVAVIHSTELWCVYGNNKVIIFDLRCNGPKLIYELEPIPNIIEMGGIKHMGQCVWLFDKQDMNVWKIDIHSKEIKEFKLDVCLANDTKVYTERGSIYSRSKHIDNLTCDNATPPAVRKHRPKNDVMMFKNIKPQTDMCLTTVVPKPLGLVDSKLKAHVDYIDKSQHSLRPLLAHIDISDMYEQMSKVQPSTPIAMMHMARETVWAFLTNGDICIFDASTTFKELSQIAILKNNTILPDKIKQMVIPTSITCVNSHIVMIRKASFKTVVDTDGLDYYVEVWLDLSADEIRSFNLSSQTLM